MVSIPREGSPVFLGTTHFVMVARKEGKAAPVHSLRFDNPLVRSWLFFVVNALMHAKISFCFISTLPAIY